MTRVEFDVACTVEQTTRVMQVSSMFDVDAAHAGRTSWSIPVPLDERAWHVGLIVGPSGAGKSSLARHLWPEQTGRVHEWSGRAIVDDFPADLGIRDVAGLLSSVGLSSPPAWLRPRHLLSGGEGFRADVARTLAETSVNDVAVVDEWTSVVDRQVAKVASHTAAKTVRARGQQLVAVTCHYDVTEWLQPDWIIDVAASSFAWRTVQPRPGLRLTIERINGRAAWPRFARHHYLSSKLNSSAQCYGVFTDDATMVAFGSYLHFPHPQVKNLKMAHRIVTLPDYQGLGIGTYLTAWMGQYLWDEGSRFRLTTAHPALIGSCTRSPRWQLTTSKGRVRKMEKTTMTGNREWKQNPRAFSTRTFQYRAAAKGETQ